MTARADPRVVILGSVLQLAQEARQAESLEAFAFLAVNALHRLISYRLAGLWVDRPGRTGILAVSGVAQVDPDSDAVQWFDKVCRHLASNDDNSPLSTIVSTAIPEGLALDWGKWTPSEMIWLPLRHPSRQTLLGGLWITRDQPFSTAEGTVLTRLTEALGETLARHLHLRATRTALMAAITRRRIGIAAVVLLATLFPVRMSVTAPAEISARDPVIVAAQRDGVVSRFLAAPNQVVQAGQPIFELDDIDVRNRHRLAARDLSIAETELKRASQASFSDSRNSAELAILGTRVDKARAEEAYAAELLGRSAVGADMDGLIVFSDPSDWIGRPVRTGERIAIIANPAKVEILVWLASTDAIALEPGSEVSMALNIAPTSPLKATLTSASYEAQMSPAGVLSYRLKAELQSTREVPRIGLRGSARIYGTTVPLIAWVFRKPLAALRQMTGL